MIECHEWMIWLRHRHLRTLALASLLAAAPALLPAQTTIDVNSATGSTVNANQTSGSPVTVNINGTSVLSGSPGILKTDGGTLIINLNGTSSINTTGIGISITTDLTDFTITDASPGGTGIVAVDEGVLFNAAGLTGNFTNNASIDSSGNTAIQVGGAVGGINSGASANQIDGSLNKDGTGSWTIDQNLSVGQGTTVRNGTLEVDTGSITNGTVINGGTDTLVGELNGENGTLTIQNAGTVFIPPLAFSDHWAKNPASS